MPHHFVLLAVGREDEDYIFKHKCLRTYTKRDYQKVFEFLGYFSGLAVCPNILTETSNLLRQCPEPYRKRFSLSLAEIARRARETHLPSESAFSDPRYPRLGLTDATILILLESGGSLLSADFELCGIAARAGLDATNYNHIRPLKT